MSHQAEHNVHPLDLVLNSAHLAAMSPQAQHNVNPLDLVFDSETNYLQYRLDWIDGVNTYKESRHVEELKAVIMVGNKTLNKHISAPSWKFEMLRDNSKPPGSKLYMQKLDWASNDLLDDCRLYSEHKGDRKLLDTMILARRYFGKEPSICYMPDEGLVETLLHRNQWRKKCHTEEGFKEYKLKTIAGFEKRIYQWKPDMLKAISELHESHKKMREREREAEEAEEEKKQKAQSTEVPPKKENHTGRGWAGRAKQRETRRAAELARAKKEREWEEKFSRARHNLEAKWEHKLREWPECIKVVEALKFGYAPASHPTRAATGH